MFRSLQLNDLTWTFSISSTIHACASTQVADDLVVGLRRRSEQDSDARAMCLRESGGTEWTDGRKGIFWGITWVCDDFCIFVSSSIEFKGFPGFPLNASIA